jgi:hypothetical protein
VVYLKQIPLLLHEEVKNTIKNLNHDYQADTEQIKFIGFKVFIAVAMKNAVFLDVAPCGSCENRRFGGTCRIHFQLKIRERVIALAVG